MNKTAEIKKIILKNKLADDSPFFRLRAALDFKGIRKHAKIVTTQMEFLIANFILAAFQLPD